MEEQTPCPEWSDKLPIMHAEDLPPSELKALRLHLTQCTRCTQIQNSYDLMVMRICTLPPVKPLTGFTPQFLEQRKKMLLSEQQNEDETVFTKSKDQKSSPIPGIINNGIAALVVLAILSFATLIFQKNRLIQVQVLRAIIADLANIPQAAFLPSLGFVGAAVLFIILYRGIKSNTAQAGRTLANLREKRWQNLVMTSVSVLILIVAQLAFLPLVSDTLTTSSSSDTIRIVSDSTDIVTTNTHEAIGLSDGAYSFDTLRIDRNLKLQASELIKNGDRAGAASLWKLAVREDTNDAEALIYLENLRVLSSSRPYITIVIGTTLTGNISDVGGARDILQGSYIAQKDYNDRSKLNGGIQVRLLIANAGSKSDYAAIVAEQIVQTAKQDRSIVGAVGWSFSTYVYKALPILARARMPMVSPTASADALTGISSFFFRVAPTNEAQAVAAANYARNQLHARRVALFVDPHNAYSKSLADDFARQFATADNVLVDTEQYTVQTGKQALPTLLQKALSSNPDLIFFSGYSGDLAVLLANLPVSQPNLQVLGGDALYQLNGYPTSALRGFGRLHFTAFAYPDEWDILNMSGQKPLFFSEYSAAFNPTGQVSQGRYGYTRADSDVILSYDATSVLLQGYNNVLKGDKNTVTPTEVRDGLAQITGAHSIQGVSGQISFGSDGNPINKAIVFLHGDSNGHIVMDNVQGCFSAGCG